MGGKGTAIACQGHGELAHLVPAPACLGECTEQRFVARKEPVVEVTIRGRAFLEGGDNIDLRPKPTNRGATVDSNPKAPAGTLTRCDGVDVLSEMLRVVRISVVIHVFGRCMEYGCSDCGDQSGGAIITITSDHGHFRHPFEVPRVVGALQSRQEQTGAAMIADVRDQDRLRTREQLLMGASQIKLTAGGRMSSPGVLSTPPPSRDGAARRGRQLGHLCRGERLYARLDPAGDRRGCKMY